MSGDVKRRYSSELRAAQARATRRAVVEAAERLFVARGYGGTTVDAIAEEAGVSRKTVFTSVGGKAEALKLALDWAVVGDDEPVPMLQRPIVKEAEQEPDVRRTLTAYARHVRQVGQRIAALDAAMQTAAGLDPGVKELVGDRNAQRLRGMRALAGLLADRGALPADLDVPRAADLLCLYNDPRLYTWLVTERRWSHDRFERWLAETLVSQLVRPGYRPRRPRKAGSGGEAPA